MNGITTVVVGAPVFVPGEQSLLFLSNGSSSDKAKNLFVCGMSQGKFNVVRDSGVGIEKVVRDQIDIPLQLEKGKARLAITTKTAMPLTDFTKQITTYLN